MLAFAIVVAVVTDQCVGAVVLRDSARVRRAGDDVALVGGLDFGDELPAVVDGVTVDVDTGELGRAQDGFKPRVVLNVDVVVFGAQYLVGEVEAVALEAAAHGGELLVHPIHVGGQDNVDVVIVDLVVRVGTHGRVSWVVCVIYVRW